MRGHGCQKFLRISDTEIGSRRWKVEAGTKEVKKLQIVEHEGEERLNKRTPNDLSMCNAAILPSEEDYARR
jgi:hypothetical protein